MSNVVPIRRCGRCGALATERDLTLRGETVLALLSCDDCVARGVAELAHVRPIFDAMIAAGVPRDLANDAMTFVLEKWTPTATEKED